MNDLQTCAASIYEWLDAPKWLTVDEACQLSGYDWGTMLHIVDVDGVDLDDAGHIEKQSLWDFQDALELVLSWGE
jgi:hypothetical protein